MYIYYLGSQADYGKPSFYSKDPQNSVQSYNRRPVVDLIRYFYLNISSSKSQKIEHVTTGLRD